MSDKEKHELMRRPEPSKKRMTLKANGLIEMNKGWHWKQHSHNAFRLSGPLGTSRWFETYDALYKFCQSKNIDATQ